MNVNISHVRNAVLGWDITASVRADGDQSISYVEIRINGFPECQEQVNPVAKQWEKQLSQQGNYPGDNKVQVTVQDDKGQSTNWVQEW